jgi:hypothetical protein
MSDNLCATVALHDGGALRPTWTRSFTSTDGGLVTLEERIIRHVATTLDVSILPQVQENLRVRLIRNQVAHQAHKEWQQQIRRRDRFGFAVAVERLNFAIQQDPRFVEAYTALAFAYRVLPEYERLPSEMMAEVRRNATLALQIDGTCGQERHWLWAVKQLHEYDWDGAEEERRDPAALKGASDIVVGEGE